MRNGKAPVLRSVQPQRMGRRVFLRGSLYGVGVSVGLPLLEVMLDGNGERLAHGAPLPVRFGVFHWGGGIAHAHWTPSGTGTGWTPKLSTEPLATPALKPYATIVTGFNHPGSSPGHIPARGIALSSSHDLTRCTGNCVGVYRGQNMPEPSLDALVAEHWKNVTKFPLLAVRVCGQGPYRSNSSWQRGGTTYNRHEVEPGAVFNRVFGTGLPTRDVGVLQASTAHEKSMLDVIRAETEALKTKLGATDRRRLEQHLEGIRALELRLQNATKPASTTTTQVCTKPTLQGAAASKSQRAKMHAEVLAAALACDLTRIFSFEWSANQSDETYPEVGMNTPHHEFTHRDSGGELHGKVIRFVMEHFAYLGQQLLAKREGTTNVLDNTLVFGTSEHASAGAHNWNDHPLVFLGKAGGRFKAGQHLRQSGGSAPRVLLTAVRAVGVNVSKLGQDGRSATEVVGDLIA